MGKLLYIQASPRTSRSHSIAVADAFVESYRGHNPDDEIAITGYLQEGPAPIRWLSSPGKVHDPPRPETYPGGIGRLESVGGSVELTVNERLN